MDPFVGEIKMFAGNFAPMGYAFCNGQLLPISQNTALFALLGTTYGGDGRTTFALPNLQGRAAMHPGAGPGLTARNLGEAGGDQALTLLSAQMPAHAHAAGCSSGGAGVKVAGGNIWANTGRSGDMVYSTNAPQTRMSPQALQPAGGSQPHNNVQPSLGLNFIIALQGVFPSRS